MVVAPADVVPVDPAPADVTPVDAQQAHAHQKKEYLNTGIQFNPQTTKYEQSLIGKTPDP